MAGMTRVYAGVAGLAASVCCAQPLAESFDTVSALGSSGWVMVNHSAPVGSLGWFQGMAASFPPQESSGYVAADYRSVALLGDISNWLMLPVRTMSNGDVLEFWTRTVLPSVYADRLQVRLSQAGSSVQVGAGPLEVGDFSTLLLDINPGYAIASSGYPTSWTRFAVQVSGLSGPVQGRLAFRYFVEHGGVNGSHSDYIGIDSVRFIPGGLSDGRCCLPSGMCIIASAADCSAQGGVFGGEGTSCAGFECTPPALGACCLAAGPCEVLSSSVCTGAGGVYRGDGSACGACPLAFGYLGDPVNVPDGNGAAECGVTVSAMVSVPVSFPIERAEVAFIIDHRWQGDLHITLTKVDGPSVTLVDRPGWPQFEYGFSADHFGTAEASPYRYFRAAPNGVVYDIPAVAFPGISSASGLWKAEQDLSAFSGTDSLGLWRLDLCDCAGGDLGQLQKFVLLLSPASGLSICYANCDGSSVPPVLTANDFQCFLNLFAAADPRANCDRSTSLPLLTANDFMCFLDRFVEGCP